MQPAQKAAELRQLIQFHRNELAQKQVHGHVSSDALEKHIQQIKEARKLLKKLSTAKQPNLFDGQ